MPESDLSPRTSPHADLRARLRPLLPGSMYRAGHRALNVAAALRWLPLREAIALGGHDRRGDETLLHPRNLLHPFMLAGDEGSHTSFVDVVLRQLYDVSVPLPPGAVIVDGGAHGGDSTAWLLSRHPDARVVAVEPQPTNHAHLVRNCAPYGERVMVLRAALWGAAGAVALVDRGRSIGVATVPVSDAEPDEDPVEAITPLGLMERSGIDRIDLLKLDVEGAEASLFAGVDTDDWLARTGAVAVELHGVEAARVVLGALDRHGFRVRQHRELHVAVR